MRIRSRQTHAIQNYHYIGFVSDISPIAGTDLDDARAMAEEALALHIEGLAEDGVAIPEPSTLEAVMADVENQDGVAILVAVKSEAKRAVRVNITLPEDVLRQSMHSPKPKG